MISKKKACQIITDEIGDVAPNLTKNITNQINACPYDPYADWTDARDYEPVKDVPVLCSGKTALYIAKWNGKEWHKYGNSCGGSHKCNPKAWMYLPTVYQEWRVK